jgi:hypothetical protein
MPPIDLNGVSDRECRRRSHRERSLLIGEQMAPVDCTKGLLFA